MVEADSIRKFEFLDPLVRGWLEWTTKARAARQPFDEIYRQCRAFHGEAVGFMWKPEFRNKYLGAPIQPRFKITLNKAFEFVATVGPSVYWQAATRLVRTNKVTQMPEEFMATDDPQEQMQFAQWAMEDQKEAGREQTRNWLMENWLNYTAKEMPGGGLTGHGQAATLEAMLSGRGVQLVEAYKMPGDDRTLTRCKHIPVNKLLIDPDCKSLDDAWAIAIECCEPVHEVEREYKLAPGSLKNKGHYESETSMSLRTSDELANWDRVKGETSDVIRYYKIWSKMGPGAKLSGVDLTIKHHLEDVVGQYAYIVVAEGVPYPLNAPSAVVGSAEVTDADVKKMFEWPTPFWRDARWPIFTTDFYKVPQSPYPLPPLAGGLGWLMYMNVLLSHAAGRAWTTSRDIWVCRQSLLKIIKPELEHGKDLAVIGLPEGMEDVDKALKLIEFPQLSSDYFLMLEKAGQEWERASGLNDYMQGVRTGTQIRTGTESANLQENSKTRPRWLSSCVGSAQSIGADMEKFCARWHVTGKDVRPLFGARGEYLWDRDLVSQPIELVARGMRADVAANASMPPNKERDAAAIGQMIGVVFPELSKHADMTGDTNPVNTFMQMACDANELRGGEGLQMGQRVPQPPPPEVAQMQQQETDLNMQKLNSDVQKAQLAVQKAQVDLQKAMAELNAPGEVEAVDSGAEEAQDLFFGEQNHEQELRHTEESHQQSLRHEAEKTRLKIGEMQAGVQARQMEQQLGMIDRKQQIDDKHAANQVQAADQHASAQQQQKQQAQSAELQHKQAAKASEIKNKSAQQQAKIAQQRASQKPTPNGRPKPTGASR